jgi:hypothetical protein
MNKYQIALNEISSAVLDVYADGYNQPRTAQECYCSSFETLQELVNKADSFEWIPVSERMPEEHDSIFARLYGTDKWNDAFWRTKSKEVLVTIEYEDGTRIVASSHTTDGKWSIEKETTLIKFKVVAWMPYPEPYKEKEND